VKPIRIIKNFTVNENPHFLEHTNNVYTVASPKPVDELLSILVDSNYNTSYSDTPLITLAPPNSCKTIQLMLKRYLLKKLQTL